MNVYLIIKIKLLLETISKITEAAKNEAFKLN